MATDKRDNVTFVFEVCASCSTHQWNTRHDEAKYFSYFTNVSALIKEMIPGATCVMNKVPKAWYEKEIYCQLIPNEDDNNPYYDILPRIGAFEVSTVQDNVDILFYSKMMSTMWPHASSLAKRLCEFNDAFKGGEAVATLKEKYQTSGRQVRAPRQRRGSVGGLTMQESKASIHDHHAASTTNLQEPVAAATVETQPQPNVQNQAEESKKPAEAQQKEEVQAASQPEPAVKETPAQEKPKEATAPAQAEPAKTETAQAEPAKAEPAQAAPAQAQPVANTEQPAAAK